MNKLVAFILTGVLIGAPITAVRAQVDIDVGGGASGSVNGSEGNADASADADIGVTVGADAPVSSDEQTTSDQSDQSSSFSLTQKDIASASLDAESAELSSASVSTSGDLQTFATAKMKRDSNIKSVEASNDRVSVEYRQPAQFLGFIPSSIRTEAEVYANGTVDVDYPWYRFLFAIEGSDTIEADIRAHAQTIMASTNGGLTASAEAELLNVLLAELSGSVVVPAGRATTADMVEPQDDSVSAETETSGDASTDIYPQ